MNNEKEYCSSCRSCGKCVYNLADGISGMCKTCSSDFRNFKSKDNYCRVCGRKLR